jgi:tetratricopeptide (TPR) repeat protein
MTPPALVKKAQGYTELAHAAEEAGDFARAVSWIDKAMQLRPDFVPYRVSRGMFLRQWLRFDESEHEIREAIKLAPSASYAWSELGLLYIDRGFHEHSRFFEQAAEYLRKSSQLRPNYSVLTVLARVELMFDPETALLDAQRALALNPNWDEAMQVREAARAAIDSHQDESCDFDRGD